MDNKVKLLIIKRSPLYDLLGMEEIDKIIRKSNYLDNEELKEEIISLIGDYSNYVDYEAEELANKLKGY